MRRTILPSCPLFGPISYHDLFMLFGCLGATTRTLDAGAALHSDRVIVVLSGALRTQDALYPEGSVLLSDGRMRPVSAAERSEALFLDPYRLQSVCGNGCACHRAVLGNLLRISLAAQPPSRTTFP